MKKTLYYNILSYVYSSKLWSVRLEIFLKQAKEVKFLSIFTHASESLVMQCAILVWVNERALNKERISLGAGSVVQRNKESREVER